MDIIFELSFKNYVGKLIYLPKILTEKYQILVLFGISIQLPYPKPWLQNRKKYLKYIDTQKKLLAK